MMTRLLFAIFALALVTAATAAAQQQNDYRPRKEDLRWGADAAGLRMAVWTNPAAAANKVFGAVRNFSKKKICYCEPPIDFFPLLYARKTNSSAWQEIKLKNPPAPFVSTSICNIKTLSPDRELSFKVEAPPGKTGFSLDLGAYDFPADWQETIEVKFVQPLVYGFCEANNQSVGEIESPVIAFKRPALSDEQQSVRRFLTDSNDALARNDAAALESFYADEWTFVNTFGGIVTKAERLADLRSGVLKYEAVTTEEIMVRLYNDTTAVAITRLFIKGTNRGRDLTGAYRVTSVLVKRDGRWQMTAQQTNRITPPPQ